MANILVIDDSRSTLALLDHFLSDTGHQVIAISDVHRALELVAGAALDLIITGIYMPEKDGLQIILAARKLSPSVPFIAVSGAGPSKDMLPVARAMGAAYTLTKPFSRDEFLCVVSCALTAAIATPEDKQVARRG